MPILQALYSKDRKRWEKSDPIYLSFMNDPIDGWEAVIIINFMQKTSKSKEKHDRSGLDRSLISAGDEGNHRHSISNYSKLANLQDRMRQLGGLEEVEEEFLKDITANNQRLDGIIAAVKALMKNDPKARRPTVSPLKKSAVIEKDKTSKRLIDRVEKALIQQNTYTHTSK